MRAMLGLALQRALARLLCRLGSHETDVAWVGRELESTCVRCGRKVRLP
jgi:hypothetical protein